MLPVRKPSYASSLSLIVLALAAFSTSFFTGAQSAHAQAGSFIRGDGNEDGFLSIADVMAVSQFVLFGASAPQCPDTADVNDDGLLNIADPLFLISFLFGPGSNFAIPAPYPDPGSDPTLDLLTCGSPLDPGNFGSELPHEFYFFSRDDNDNEDFAIAPGTGLVSIPIHMSAISPFGVEGLAVSLSFDPAIVAEAIIDFTEGAPDDYNADLRLSHVSDFDAGRIFGYVVMELIEPFHEPDFPVEENQLLGHLNLRLHENVTPGTTFDVQFSTLPPQAGSAPIRNEIVKSGGVGLLYPHTYPITITVRPESEIFIRGDLNRDGTVNTSDGFGLISYLYSGFSLTPPCLDAADLDDSGTIDLSDAIILLSTVFSGNTSLRPSTPYPYQGVDATEDSLQCLSSS